MKFYVVLHKSSSFSSDLMNAVSLYVRNAKFSVLQLKMCHINIFLQLGQKKLIICFSDTARVTFNPPPHQKFLLHFQYSHLKIVYTSRIVSLGRPSFAAILSLFNTQPNRPRASPAIFKHVGQVPYSRGNMA